MKIALLNTKNTPRARYLLDCFREGAETLGDSCLWVEDGNELACLDEADVAVQVCFVNRRHADSLQDQFRVQAYRKLVAQGKRLLVIDSGFVKGQCAYELAHGKLDPETDRACPDDAQIYYQVGYDGIKRHAACYSDRAPADRWSWLQTPIHPWQTAGQHVLILGQARFGQSSQHVDIVSWCGSTAAKLAGLTQRPLRLRQHPRVMHLRSSQRKIRDERAVILQAAGSLAKRISWSEQRFLEDDLRGAWAVVAFSTNAAVTGVLAGVPTIACDPACAAWPVSGRSLAEIDKPPRPERSQWAYDLAYCQWNCLELRRGDCWKHLREHASKPATRREDL